MRSACFQISSDGKSLECTLRGSYEMGCNVDGIGIGELSGLKTFDADRFVMKFSVVFLPSR